jgi:hypothetical protein
MFFGYNYRFQKVKFWAEMASIKAPPPSPENRKKIRQVLELKQISEAESEIEDW